MIPPSLQGCSPELENQFGLLFMSFSGLFFRENSVGYFSEMEAVDTSQVFQYLAFVLTSQNMGCSSPCDLEPGLRQGPGHIFPVAAIFARFVEGAKWWKTLNKCLQH